MLREREQVHFTCDGHWRTSELSSPVPNAKPIHSPIPPTRSHASAVANDACTSYVHQVKLRKCEFIHHPCYVFMTSVLVITIIVHTAPPADMIGTFLGGGTSLDEPFSFCLCQSEH